MEYNIYFNLKRGLLDQWATVGFFFSSLQVKNCWHHWFRSDKILGMQQHKPQCTPCQVLESTFHHNQENQDCSHPRYLCTSSHHTFPVQSTIHEYRKLWYGTQRTASLFTFCIFPSFWRVSVAVIWTTVKLSSPWFCCVDRTILWDRCYSYGLNCNVLKLEKNESR